jgi:hypothetical protein
MLNMPSTRLCGLRDKEELKLPNLLSPPSPNQAKLPYRHVNLAVLFICVLISVLLLCATIDAIDRHERQNNPSATMGGFGKGNKWGLLNQALAALSNIVGLRK